MLSSCGPGSTRPPPAALSTATSAASSSVDGAPLTTLISSTPCVGASSMVNSRGSLTSVMWCSSLLTVIRSFARSQWNVPVLLRRRLGDLSFQQTQGGGDVAPGVRWRDDGVDVTALGGDVRVHEGVL